jgi:hypothetical protein
MKASFGSSPAAMHDERGAARLKLIIVLAIVALVGYMAFQYVPVAYQARSFKSFMQERVQVAADDPSVPIDEKASRVETQLKNSASQYGVPPDAKMSHVYQNGRLEVTVKFTRQINLLPGFTYQYDFDYTAKSDNSLNPQ